MTPEEKELVDFIASEDNQFWSRQSPNEQKSSRNIKEFFEQRIDPLDELGEDFFDFRELQLDPARLDLKNQGEEDFQLPFQWESRPSGKSDTLKVEPNDKFVV